MQLSLFDAGAPAFDPDLKGLRRFTLDRGAWVDYLPNWLVGHESVYRDLALEADWVHHRRVMYERTVQVPRLTAAVPAHHSVAALLGEISWSLSLRYGFPLAGISLAWYRDGNDSVAYHGDRIGRHTRDTVIAIVSVGVPRRFLLRPVAGGTSKSFRLGWGDLLVMGGSCQRTWQHGIPKVAHADPRISIQFRPRESAAPETVEEIHQHARVEAQRVQAR
jgi:alkylated DNA repair dioxygenase AlkB